ncbi:pyridoxal 5'-phosphate synthase pdxS subunit [Propionibacterium cyclohexanicum]|uniref:Pyridoxal 5'-phosphate synthase subunit PdxS n=2 Tax=Propionibacterium cyclohexanicum TaxID=64702 RepID=A0A1H9PN41_9ACTN|nr:pyridoxal 5'-phosphate synthase pdxS subunit [Propionibacterium cyclohexanicum]
MVAQVTLVDELAQCADQLGRQPEGGAAVELYRQIDHQLPAHRPIVLCGRARARSVSKWSMQDLQMWILWWSAMGAVMALMTEETTATTRVKRGLADMLKGGVIMDVVTPEQARIAEDAGASAVMALERVPADIRAQGGVARMSDPGLIEGIQAAVSIPVMAKARIGHFVEAQVLQSLRVDFVDESEVLSPADYSHHIDKWEFDVPFVCGATNLGEALRRITEGAAMIRSKGEAGTGDVSEAVRHIRTIRDEINRLHGLGSEELYVAAKDLQAPYDLVREVARTGGLPVVLFVAGGVATPADAALVMQLGAEGVFVGSGIFKSGNPAKRAAAIVKATTLYNDPDAIAEVSHDLGDAMVGINVSDVPAPHRLAERGW